MSRSIYFCPSNQAADVDEASRFLASTGCAITQAVADSVANRATIKRLAFYAQGKKDHEVICVVMLPRGSRALRPWDDRFDNDEEHTVGRGVYEAITQAAIHHIPTYVLRRAIDKITWTLIKVVGAKIAHDGTYRAFADITIDNRVTLNLGIAPIKINVHKGLDEWLEDEMRILPPKPPVAPTTSPILRPSVAYAYLNR